MKESLSRIARQFSGKRVAVWGDVILDEYIFTSTGRVSREAPVLITEYENSVFKPGGAGNVILNLKTLGAEVFPTGFIGNDSAGNELLSIFEEQGITTEFFVKPEDYTTPKKSRILSGGDHTKKQQVLRIDTIDKKKISETHYSTLFDSLSTVFGKTDIVIISDYIHKSVLPEFYTEIRKQYPGIKFILDSRKNFLDFPGIDIATPNEPETRQMFSGRELEGFDDFTKAGRDLQKLLKAPGIIMKLGHNGMIVFDGERTPAALPIHGNDDIVDVTGAGDTVIATLSIALASGADLKEAAQLATVAAGFVVMKEGAYPITKEELINELR